MDLLERKQPPSHKAMSTSRIIKRLAFESRSMVYATEKQPIEVFMINGEMAPVAWYRFGNLEFNGKYVTEIEYEDYPPKL